MNKELGNGMSLPGAPVETKVTQLKLTENEMEMVRAAVADMAMREALLFGEAWDALQEKLEEF